MVRKFWVFLGTLCLLIGFEIVMTQSVILTSRCTEILAKRDPKIERKLWWVRAFSSDELEYPEKKVDIKPLVGYVFLFAGGIGYMHSFLILSGKEK